MHSRGLSDMFQPCGVARVMDTVDDDRPLTASAVTEKKYRPVWSVNDKSGETVDRRCIQNSPLVGCIHGLFYASAEALAYDRRAYEVHCA